MKRVALIVLGLVLASGTLVAKQYDFTYGQLFYKITDTAKREAGHGADRDVDIQPIQQPDHRLGNLVAPDQEDGGQAREGVGGLQALSRQHRV